ncbi:hypothetical protein ACE1CA_12270 [Aerosakkonemataceae cyanobacterium BLCC-F167]|uniref:Uncharacterized protein n=1 Tax=Floridaenema evergladense BLCC-F167 TaxID=3153639 RepID=A0ABV4WJP1_9CYAN
MSACTELHKTAQNCMKLQKNAVNEATKNDASSVVASNGIVRTNSLLFACIIIKDYPPFAET